MARPRRSFPLKVARAFKTLAKELANLYVRWTLYRQVFGAEETVLLVNRFGSAFFGNVQLILLDDMVLGLCRLTDPAVQRLKYPRRKGGRPSYTVASLSARLVGKMPNFTLERLVALVAEDLEKQLEAHSEEYQRLKAFGQELGRRLRTIVRLRNQHFKKRRNKRIAHNDFHTLRSFWAGRPTPLIPSSQLIEEFLAEVARLMNAVQLHYGKGETVYGETILPLGVGGDMLVGYLREIAARMEAGDPFRPRWSFEDKQPIP